MSKGSNAIKNWLTDNEIFFEEEISVEINGRKLRYDFYIPSVNCYVEFDGEQHFKPISHFHKEPHSFLEAHQRDLMKNDYARNNDINLIRIPYWKEEKIPKILKETIDYLEKETGGFLSVSLCYYTRDYKKNNCQTVITETVAEYEKKEIIDEEFLKLVEPFETAPKNPDDFISWLLDSFNGSPIRYAKFIKNLPFLRDFRMILYNGKYYFFKFIIEQLVEDEEISIISNFIKEINDFMNALISKMTKERNVKRIEKMKSELNKKSVMKETILCLYKYVEEYDIHIWKSLKKEEIDQEYLKFIKYQEEFHYISDNEQKDKIETQLEKWEGEDFFKKWFDETYDLDLKFEDKNLITTSDIWYKLKTDFKGRLGTTKISFSRYIKPYLAEKNEKINKIKSGKSYYYLILKVKPKKETQMIQKSKPAHIVYIEERLDNTEDIFDNRLVVDVYKEMCDALESQKQYQPTAQVWNDEMGKRGYEQKRKRIEVGIWEGVEYKTIVKNAFFWKKRINIS